VFITPEDFRYLEGLHATLDATRRERFMAALLGKAAAAEGGKQLHERIRVVGEEIYNERGVDPKEWITRTMIKKAYKEAKQ